jgi:uncharacterized hydrophobic protein (TIGR00271 family)
MPKLHSLVSPETLHEDLVDAANLDLNFLVLVVSSCIIATLGLLINSAGVIIGAMIIAPLMNPLRSLALGALIADQVLLRRSLITLGVGTALAIVTSAILGSLFQIPALSFGSEILARTQPTLADLGVALAAGGVSGFAKIRPKVSDVLAGTAIAVALMPPLCVVGIALSQGAWAYSSGSFLLFLTNLLGITLACILTFIWGGYGLNPRDMRRAVLWFMVLTGLILFPLSFSLIGLIQQEQLKASIKDLLKRETITLGQQAQLVNIDLFRSTLFGKQSGDRVTITVAQEAGKEITPRQVKELEKFLQQRTKRPIQLIVRAFNFQSITPEELSGN